MAIVFDEDCKFEYDVYCITRFKRPFLKGRYHLVEQAIERTAKKYDVKVTGIEIGDNFMRIRYMLPFQKKPSAFINHAKHEVKEAIVAVAPNIKPETMSFWTGSTLSRTIGRGIRNADIDTFVSSIGHWKGIYHKELR